MRSFGDKTISFDTVRVSRSLKIMAFLLPFIYYATRERERERETETERDKQIHSQIDRDR